MLEKDLQVVNHYQEPGQYQDGEEEITISKPRRKKLRKLIHQRKVRKFTKIQSRTQKRNRRPDQTNRRKKGQYPQC